MEKASVWSEKNVTNNIPERPTIAVHVTAQPRTLPTRTQKGVWGRWRSLTREESYWWLE